ncbi:MAG: Holliday junction resolvase-like protein [Candidatus Woesearchaeota archaeon]
MWIYLLLTFLILIAFFIGRLIGKLSSEKSFKQRLLDARKDAANRSRAVMQGQISEQLAPFLPGFEYDAADARFIGKPVDFLVFKGLSNKKIEEVIFVEVKTSNSNLSKNEKDLKEVIKNKKVKWFEFRI